MTEKSEQPQAAPNDGLVIEVGEIASDGLRLWCARQAVEHAKQRLDFQEACLDGIISRSGQTLGWSITVSCAFLVLTSSQKLPYTMLAFSLFSVMTAICTIMVMRPRGWAPGTQTPEWFVYTELTNELAVLEHLAMSFQAGIESNRPRMTTCARWLEFSWISFAAMPIAAAFAHLITGR
ncbi:hypothetical protein [Acetobacter fabarum]|uniref:Uncharacterized protein n=1 Tax=Acetobacter fabarum TaxID=483199 RepID=A0A269XWY3_9PROT|nr:hypothetical protein [Acetobacter fabarum]PAK77807.1 hypothetical protein B8X00_09015 [Acetobacter fabarum]PEN28163.1 hypothetical protein CRM93_03820 [Acetobacter fabarum]